MGRGGDTQNLSHLCSSVHCRFFHAISSWTLTTLLLASWSLNFDHFRGVMNIWFAVTLVVLGLLFISNRSEWEHSIQMRVPVSSNKTFTCWFSYIIVLTDLWSVYVAILNDRSAAAGLGLLAHGQWVVVVSLSFRQHALQVYSWVLLVALLTRDLRQCYFLNKL